MSKKSATISLNTTFFLISFLFSVSICFAQVNRIEGSLTTITSDYVDKNNVPGFAACVVKDGKILWSNAYGHADIEKDIPMSVEAIMTIASVSKTITTTAVLQLWEKGKLDLDADVNEYLQFSVRNPNFPETPITVKQLLTHTSSINDSDLVYSYACGDPTVTLEEWIKNYFESSGKYYDKKNNFHAWNPGKERQYSNVAFGLLGFMVEEISKQPFNEYCKTNIITPLGMNNSGWFIKEVDTLKQAKLYVKASRRNKINEWLGKLISKQTGDYFQLCNYSFFNYPDGLLKTSVKELSNFMIAIMDQGAYNGQQILEKATVSRMLTPQLEGNGLQGLGWKKIKSEPLWGHGGSDPGIQTRMYFNPETNVGIILFQNTGRGNTFKLVKNMYSLIVDNEE